MGGDHIFRASGNQLGLVSTQSLDATACDFLQRQAHKAAHSRVGTVEWLSVDVFLNIDPIFLCLGRL